MTYTKTTWNASTAITSARLDNLETQYAAANSDYLVHSHGSLYYSKSEMKSTYFYSENDGSGSTSNVDLLYSSGGNKHSSDFSGASVQTGLIVLWYGSVATIPTGWHLCDGTEGTVDLTGKFVVGAGDTYNVNDTGGATTFTVAGTITVDAHVLTESEMGSHRHPFDDFYFNASSIGWTGPGGGLAAALFGYTGTTPNNVTTASGHTHTTGEGNLVTGNAVSCLPHTFALCYIQKI